VTKVELHTAVNEVISAEDVPGFVIKKVDLGGISLKTPVRTLYSGTDIPARTRRNILNLKERKETLLEVNRTVYMDKSYDSILRAIQESDDDGIRNIFKLSEALTDYNIALPFSFSKFPHMAFGRNYFEKFLDYLHGYSSVVFVPHVRFARESGRTAVNYNVGLFAQYVDDAVKTLNEWNTKSIFVPLDIDYPDKIMDEILMHYAKNGYTNIWIDFKGRTFTGTRIGRMRNIRRKISKFFGPEGQNVVIYLANIKKIQREHPKEIKFRPSDILGVFVYGDIVGIPWKGIVRRSVDSENDEYWVKKGFSTKEEYEAAIFKRDVSVFDNNSYYYWHLERIYFHNTILNRLCDDVLSIGPKQKSVAEKISHSISNTIALHELGKLKHRVLSEGTITDYLVSKEFFATSGKAMLTKISIKQQNKKNIAEKPKKDLFDFFPLD